MLVLPSIFLLLIDLGLVFEHTLFQVMLMLLCAEAMVLLMFLVVLIILGLGFSYRLFLVMVLSLVVGVLTIMGAPTLSMSSVTRSSSAARAARSRGAMGSRLGLPCLVAEARLLEFMEVASYKTETIMEFASFLEQVRRE